MTFACLHAKACNGSSFEEFSPLVLQTGLSARNRVALESF